MITTFDGYKKRDGNNSNVLLDGGETKPKWQLDNRIIVSDTTETGDKLSSSTGSFTFQGNNLINNQYDWVGLQVSSSVDRGQLVWDNGTLRVRQNDGSDWTEWATLLNDKNWSSYITHQSVTNSNPSLKWNTTHTIGSVGGTNLQFTFGDNEGSSDFTDGTELLSSYASNDGFAVSGTGNKVIYRRKASSMYNYLKGKFDLIYLTSHQSLSNYYNKTEIDNKLSSILDVQIVQSLPTISNAVEKTLYLMANSETETNELYKEYIKINKGTSESPNWVFEKLGGVTLNVSNFVTAIGISNQQLTWTKGSTTQTPINIDAKTLLGKGLNSTYGGILYVKDDGVMEAGRYLDFHTSSNDTRDYAVRLQVSNTTGTYTQTLPSNSGTIALTSDLSSYVKLDPGAVEQTVKSSIGSMSKGVVNLWRDSGNHYTFLGFSNGTTETYLGGIGFTAQGNTCPYYLNTSGNVYPLYHSNNLPTRTFITGYTNTDKVGWWCPFATIEFKSRYKSQSATLCFQKYYTNDSNSNHRGGFLFINVQQQTALGAAPYISLYTIGLNPEFVKAITTLSSTSNKIDFYIKLDKHYQYYYISKINGDDIINIRSLIQTLPSGTQYDCKSTIKADTGISLSYDSDGTMAIANSSPNQIASLYLGSSSGTTDSAQSTNGNTYLILNEGNNYIRKKICGYTGISVTNTTSEIKITGPNLSSYALSSSLSNYVLKTGDTMSGSLTLFSNSSVENIVKVKTKRNVSSGTGWAFSPLTIIGNDDAIIANFGVLGNKQNFTYLYIGSGTYDSLNNFRIYSDHVQSSYLDIDRSNYGSLPQGTQLSVIRARMCNSGTGTYGFQNIISVFGSGETGSTVNNLPVRIGSPSGATVVSAGEGGTNFISAEPTIGSTKNLYLTSDGQINLYTNCNTIANRKHVQIDTSGNIAIKKHSGGVDTWYSAEGYTYKLTFGIGTSNINRGIYQFKASTNGSGTYSSGKWLLYFNAGDDATFTSDVIATSFYSSSDIRLKNIISNPTYKAEDFANLDLVKYTWKNNEDKVHLGSIAQSAEKEFPELVNTNHDGYKSLDYSVLGTVGVISLAKEIIELKEEIKKLKSKLYG